MAEPVMCECDGTVFPCRHHPELFADGEKCGMPAKMLAWPSRGERDGDVKGEKAIRLCLACAGASISKGWALRSDPHLWGRR
jgi:hypothetical protein